MRSRTIAASLCLLTLLACAPTLRAQDTLLKIVPADVYGVAFLARPNATGKKIDHAAQQLHAPLPPIDVLIGTLGMNAGFDNQGTVGFLLLPHDHGKPESQVIAVPVTDYKAFLAQLKPGETDGDLTKAALHNGAKECWVAKKDSYALIAPVHRDPAEAKAALKHVLEAKTFVTTEFAPLQSWIAEQDIALVGTAAGTKFILEEGSAGLQKIKDRLPPGAPNIDQAKQSIDLLAPLLDNAKSEISQGAVGARLDDKGNLRVSTRTLFAPGGKLAAFAKAPRAADRDPLAALPGGPYLVSFGASFSPELMQGLVPWAMKMQANAPGWKDLSPADRDRLTKIATDIGASMRGVAMELKPLAKGASLYSGLLGAIQVEDATKFMEQYEKSIRDFAKLTQSVKIPGGISDVQKVDVGGLAALEISMDMTSALPPGLPPGADVFMKVLVGDPKNFKAYLAKVDDKTVAVTYVDKNNLALVAAAVKNPSSALSADANLAKTKAALPAGGQAYGYLNLGGLVATAKTGIDMFAPGAIALPDFPAAPPLGKVVKLTPVGLETELILPSDLMDAIGKFTTSFGPPGAR